MKGEEYAGTMPRSVTMYAQIERTLRLVELLFDTGYLDIAEEPEQEKLTEAFILFCVDNGCFDVDYWNAERKAFEIYAKQYQCGTDDNSGSSDCDDEFEKEAEKIDFDVLLASLKFRSVALV